MGVLLLVRHGQASFGAADYDVLSETGHAQGRLLGAWLAERGVTPTAVLRGDLRRHRETAAAMVEGAGWSVPDVTVDPAWDEFDHVGLVTSYPDLSADLDLSDRRAFQRVFEEATAHWMAGEPGDYAETAADFSARVRGALARAVEVASAPGSTVLVVTSGGPVAVCAAELVHPGGADRATTATLWSRFNTVMVNSSVTRVVVGSTGPRLLTFNEHPHLDDAHRTYR